MAWWLYLVLTVVGAALAVWLVRALDRLSRDHGTPKAWLQSARQALRVRRSRRQRAAHDVLVQHVLERASSLQDEVLSDVRGSEPALLTYHPSGRVFAWYRDLARYKADFGRTHSGTDAGWKTGAPPRPIHTWTDDKLRAWLTEHPDSADNSGN